MAKLKPEIQWFYDPNTYWKEYGLIVLGDKWAVVKSKDFEVADNYDVVTLWVDDRETAIGLLKLLKETI